MLPRWMLGEPEPPEEKFTDTELGNLRDLRELVRIGVYYQDYPSGANLDRLRFVKWLREKRGLFDDWSASDA